METLTTAFKDIIKEVLARSKQSTVVTEQNVYQIGADDILPFLNQMVESLALPGSGIDGMEHLQDLWEKAAAGKSCLLLPEHYSNMDLSIIIYLLQQAGNRGADIARSIVAIAGMKLTEDNPAVAAFAGAYTRIVIYPSRSLIGLDPEKDRAEIVRSNGINRAAMKTLNEVKVGGKIILVFPSGTRYRPWEPNSKKGVREIDSYVKSFDYMCPVALNGEVLHVRQGDMLDDSVSKDLLRVTASPVISCADFRAKARADAEAAGIEDKKQAVADAIMKQLEDMHNEAEVKRLKALGTNHA
ncbi:glycerol-3-phosphate O-acyltransferase [Spirochaetia bacterium]|nr:glycerol-3-phosphate O-acyltransferase [Spirochaetia bacterium]